MHLDETDTRFYIAPSTIPGAGNGVFTKIPLAKGDRLEVIGVLVRVDSIADICTRYTDRYKFRMGDKLLIPLGYGGMANHSDTPNMEKIIDGDKVYLRALRPIESGEEILYIYGATAQAQFRK